MYARAVGAYERRLRNVGYWLVIGLAILLPSIDRRANVLALLLAVVVFLRVAILQSDFFKRWDGVDWCMAALLGSALASTAFGWPSDGYHGIVDGVAHLTVFATIRHGGLDEEQLRRIGIAIVGGVLVALAIMFVQGMQAGGALELHGIGGTIRSSLYTGIVLTLCIGFALSTSGIQQVIWGAVTLIIVAALFSMTSRAVVSAFLVSLFLGLLAQYRRHAVKAALLAIPLIAIAVALVPQNYHGQLEYKAKEMWSLVAHGDISENDQARLEFWQVSLAWIKRGQHVLFGIGSRNFHKIDAEQLSLPGPLRFSEQTRHPAHAHNMYVTRYVEQGLVGLSAMVALFVLIAKRLLHDGLASRTSWAWWGALGGLMLPVLNGLVGSPWYRDYAWLAVLTFALYLAPRKKYWRHAGKFPSSV